MGAKLRTAPRPAESPADGELNTAEICSIHLMMDLAAAFGIQRSVAQIYGLLFVAPQPVSFDEMVAKLRISAGSVSQGLRFLRNLGAAIPVVEPGDRRTLYRAETRLKVLMPGFIKEQLVPRLETWPQRVGHLRGQADSCSPDQQRVIKERCQQLEGWMSKTRLVLPLLLKAMGIRPGPAQPPSSP